MRKQFQTAPYGHLNVGDDGVKMKLDCLIEGNSSVFRGVRDDRVRISVLNHSGQSDPNVGIIINHQYFIHDLFPPLYETLRT